MAASARRALVLAALLAPAGPPASAGDPPPAREGLPRGAVVEYVSASSPGAREPGRTSWPAGATVRFTAHLRHLGPAGSAPVPDRGAWSVDGAFAAQNRDVSASREPPFRTEESIRWTAVPGRRTVRVEWGGDACEAATDAVSLRLLVERRTREAFERGSGSFARRFRRSLDDLHAAFAASVHPLAPRGVLARFRVDEVLEYDRTDGPPEDSGSPDLAVACDEGGPEEVRGARIVHAFLGPDGRGLFSEEGERRLWAALLRSRGVPDFARFSVEAGALPGRAAEAIPLPDRLRGLTAEGGALRVGEAAAVLANAHEGARSVPDPGADDGPVWTRVPARVVLALVERKTPLVGVEVRWWRSRRDPSLLDARVPGVAPGRPPDGRSTTDARGQVTLSGDLFGRDSGEPSRWLLVEVDGLDGAERSRRFEVIPVLDLNLDYARGDKHATIRLLRREELRVPVGADGR